MTDDTAHQSLQHIRRDGTAPAETPQRVGVMQVIKAIANRVWTWKGLIASVEAETRYVNAWIGLKRSNKALDELNETLQREKEVAIAKHNEQMAGHQLRTETQEYARKRLADVHGRELERIKAQTKEYAERGAAALRHPNDEITDPAIREIRQEIARFLERDTYIEPLVREANEKIDRLVEEGKITKEEGEEKKRNTIDYVRSRLMQE